MPTQVDAQGVPLPGVGRGGRATQVGSRAPEWGDRMTEDRRCLDCAHSDFIAMTNLESGQTVVHFTWLCRRGEKSRKVELNDTCKHWRELGSDGE